jgi:hypothetical protein
MVTLNKNKEKKVILMQDLKNGQIAVVLKNDGFSRYEGKIVQRYGNSAVSIGEESGEGWSNIQENTLKVRILKQGEILTISDNK